MDKPKLLRKVSLRQMHCFVEVARRRSFVSAANAIGITQSAVSRSVRELEQILGIDLVDRTHRVGFVA